MYNVHIMCVCWRRWGFRGKICENICFVVQKLEWLTPCKNIYIHIYIEEDPRGHTTIPKYKYLHISSVLTTSMISHV